MAKKLFIRSAHNYDRDLASDMSGLACKDPTRTQQHHKEECDINTIVRRFGLTGQLPENVQPPRYGDFTGVTDYRTALHQIQAAEDSFMQMPAAVRKRFDNDPQQFLMFCEDPRNLDEARKMGLAMPKPEVAPEPPKEPQKPA